MLSFNSPFPRRLRARRLGSRHGVATLVVLLLVSIALALSYATVRWQATAMQIQRNAHLTADARQAAITGLTLGLKKMHTADWDGVDTTLSGSLGPYQSYEVTYTTGDPSLTADHPDYGDFPYRVTLLSRGYAVGPGDSDRSAVHRARAVVRLVPRKLADEPDDWDEIQDYTLYQYTGGAFRLSVPYRVEGAVRIQRSLNLSEASLWLNWHWYKWDDEARCRFLADLEAMRRADMGDFRPFDGPLHLPYGFQESGLVDLLSGSMDIPTDDVPADSADGWDHPGALTTYRIYPGGKVYSATQLGYSLQNEVLQPDVQDNPLGIYCRRGTLWLRDNVKIRGTLVTRSGSDGDLYVYGKNVHLEPLDLPPLEGTDRPIQLPTAVLGDDLQILAGSEASIAGMLAMWDDFDVQEDSQEAAVELEVTASDAGRRLDDFLADQFPNHSPAQRERMIRARCVRLDGADAQPGDVLPLGGRVRVFPQVLIGRIVAKDVKIAGRQQWDQPSGWWNGRYNDFRGQEDHPDGTPYFPAWLNEKSGLNPEPQLGIRPDPAEPRYHWKNRDDPIYVPHPDDATPLEPDSPGLRWDLLDWTDNPPDTL